MMIMIDLSYPTIDNIMDEIAKVGEDVLLYKLDISRAFRNLRIDPRDYGVMGLQWDHNYYVDVSVAFGYKHGSAQMQRLRDTIRHVMTSQRYAVFPYIDDIIGVQSAVDAQRAFDTLKALVDNLGLPINPKKLVSPAKQVICMGILIDVENNILKIPDRKMAEIKSLCKKWAQKTTAIKRQLKSLLEKLLYIHCCVRPSRLFVNRMLALLRNSHNDCNIHLTDTFQRKTRDEVLALYARSIWLLIASNDIQTQYCHVQGVNNVYADRLLRWFSKDIEGDIKDILHSKTWHQVTQSCFIPNYNI